MLMVWLSPIVVSHSNRVVKYDDEMPALDCDECWVKTMMYRTPNICAYKTSKRY